MAKKRAMGLDDVQKWVLYIGVFSVIGAAIHFGCKTNTTLDAIPSFPERKLSKTNMKAKLVQSNTFSSKLYQDANIKGGAESPFYEFDNFGAESQKWKLRNHTYWGFEGVGEVDGSLPTTTSIWNIIPITQDVLKSSEAFKHRLPNHF